MKKIRMVKLGGAVAISLISAYIVTPQSPLFLPPPTVSTAPAPVQSSSSILPASSQAANLNEKDKRASSKNQSTTNQPAGFVANNPPQVALDEEPRSSKVITTPDGKKYPVRVYKPLAVPNDPYVNQWWVASSGLDDAWSLPAGPYQTTVAVIDTGFALKHQEFSNRWQLNTGESGITVQENPSDLNCSDQSLSISASCNNIDDDYDGVVDNEFGPASTENPSKLNCTDSSLPLDKSCNNIDDDGNGYADDVRGWDFASFDASVQAGETNPSGTGTTHGTMVAGMLAANGNNGVGMAGVNWATKILPIQALDDDSYGDTLTVARSVRYAADQDVDIISISLGADAEDPYLREAIDYALDNGSLVVAASGNEGCQCISYPARYPEVIAVGASSSAGAAAGFSNYGAELDVLAPGVDLTLPSWSTTYSTNGYTSGANGTSFSTPYISGLLALARSHQPNASWGELTAALFEEANHQGLSASVPHSSTVGYGLAQADKLLLRSTTPLTSTLRYQFGPVSALDALDTERAYQCESGRHASTKLYTLTRSGEVRYTSSKLAVYRAAQDGWTSKVLAHTCVGLPGDELSTLRVINLLSEVNNQYR